MHNASKHIIKILLDNEINTLIVDKNKEYIKSIK